MKKFYLLLIYLILNIPTIATAQDSYLCVSEAIGGISYDAARKKWEGTKITNDNNKLIITKKNNLWKLKEFGGSTEFDCDEPRKTGSFRCEIFFGEFLFNPKTKRFLQTFIFGYIDGKDNNENTPSIIIGKCSPL